MQNISLLYDYRDKVDLEWYKELFNEIREIRRDYELLIKIMRNHDAVFLSYYKKEVNLDWLADRWYITRESAKLKVCIEKKRIRDEFLTVKGNRPTRTRF